MNTPLNDALLQCLLMTARYHGINSTVDTLTAGLPLEDNCLTPSLFLRAAKRVGLISEVIETEIEDIDQAQFPVVLLLETGEACLLTGWSEDGGAAQIIYPHRSENAIAVELPQLQSTYTGMAIVARPKYQFDQRTERDTQTNRGHWFWDALRENVPIYRDVLLASFFINVFALAMPLFMRNVFDRVVPNHAIETLWVLSTGVMLVMLAAVGLRIMRAYFLDIAGRRVDIRLSASIMERVLGTRLESRAPSVGAHAARLRSFETVRDFITSAAVSAIIDVPFALIFIVAIGWIAWQLLIPIVLGIALVLLYAWLIKGKLQGLTETTYRASAMRNATLIESLVGLDTLKAMGAEGNMQRKWENNTAFLARVSVQQKLLSSSSVNLTSWAQQMVTVSVIIGGVYLVIDGQLSMGGLLACFMLSRLAMAPFGPVAGLMAQYHNAAVAMKSLDEIMDSPLDRPEQTQFLSRDSFRGEIEFKNVSFSYPGSEQEPLKGVSFRLRPGEHVAILGRVGSGKSTLQKLAMGLYQPTSGSVLVDGIDMRQLDPAQFRHRVGYVPQDVTLFYGSLRDNLTMAHPQSVDADLLRVAELAGLTEFVNRHPQGFDMQVGERGESLSGGQRKSVALARGLVNDPTLLLMDEPTGSMDHSTEATIIKQLAKYIEGRSLLMVTHRTSLLKLMDRIIVIDNGKLVADGPKANVMEALRQGKIGGAAS
ncbi:MAG: ATP-binding cassette subfamily C protein LapB [Paraglaciecola psychrophila]|jgi:ATP-binding cassette subfamily C protein LapB